MRLINQQQLARRLKLSRTTVSRSLSNHPAISAETREKVLAAAAQAGYKKAPTRAVKRSKQAKPLTIGVLIGTPLAAADKATFPSILQGMRRRAAIEHLHLDVLSLNPEDLTEETGRRQLFRQIRQAGWRGVVLVYPFPEEAVAMIAQKMTVVSVLTEYPTLSVDVIDTDHGGVRHLVARLVELGHRNIGFVTWAYPAGGLWASRRFAAFSEEMMARGLSYKPEWVLNLFGGGPRLKTHEAVAAKVASLREHDGVTAWVCAADHQAYQLIADLRARGLRVPEDISLTGFDGNDAPPGFPKVATLSVPNEEIGSSTVARIVSRLLHPRSPRRKILVETSYTPGATLNAVP